MDESANTPEHDRPLDVPDRRDPTAPAATELGHEIEDEGPEPHIDAHLDAGCVSCWPTRPTPVRCPPRCPNASPGPCCTPPGCAWSPARSRSGPRQAALTVRTVATARRRHGARDAVALRTAQADLPRRRGRRGCGRRRRGGLSPAPDEATERCGGHRRPLQLRRQRVAVESPVEFPIGCPVQPTGHRVRPAHPAQHDGILPRQARRAGQDAPRPSRSADRRPGSRVTGHRSHRHPTGLESCLRAIGARGGADPAPEAVSADLATFDGHPRSWWS